MWNQNRARLACMLLPILDRLEVHELRVCTRINDVEISIVIVDLVPEKRRECTGLVHLCGESLNLGPVVLNLLESAFELGIAALGDLPHVRPLALRCEREEIQMAGGNLESPLQRPSNLPDRVVIMKITEIRIQAVFVMLRWGFPIRAGRRAAHK